LARRLSVREDSVRHWLNGRRPIPPNVERWLYAVRDSIATAPALPDGWLRPGG
jgi:DNA-binding transcriptional regulator YdaS (Cro superfamily)